MSPKTMNKEDVKTILLDHKERVGNADMVIEHLLLRNLLEFSDNDAYRKCMREYPGLKPVVKHKRNKHMDEDVIDHVLKSKGIDMTFGKVVDNLFSLNLKYDCELGEESFSGPSDLADLFMDVAEALGIDTDHLID